MYKKLLALCLAALLTASAAGCSQGTEGSSAPAEGGSAPAGDAAPSGEVVTIRMGGWGNFEDEHAPGTVGMEEAIGVKIEFQKYPTALLALIFLVPVFYVMYNSLLPKRYIGSFVPPSVWSLDNYKELFADFPIMGWYKNTAISTLAVVLGNIVFTPMAGYGLARLRFPGKKVIFVCLMLSMMIPGQLVLLPQYIMMAQMGLVDTLAAIIIPYLSQSMFIFMARQFFYGIPEELEEAARIDGLGRFGTYVRIVLPISGVLIATIAIFNFTGTWNSYLVPSTFISTLEKFVLVVGLQTVNNEHFQQENLTLAGVFLLSFPVIIFFMFTQKFFVQGIATSGIKS